MSALTPEQDFLVGILETVEAFFVDSGMPLTAEQSAALRQVGEEWRRARAGAA